MGSTIIRPNSAILTDWQYYDPALIDDAVQAPTAPTGGADRCAAFDKSDNNTYGHWGFGNIGAEAGATTDSVRLFVYQSLSGGTLTNYEAKINNSWLGAKTSSDGTSGGWLYFDWTISHSMASVITNNEFKLQATGLTNGDEVYVWAAYMEIFWTVAGGGGGSPIIPILRHWHEEHDDCPEF